jgi:hypothetical protein
MRFIDAYLGTGYLKKIQPHLLCTTFWYVTGPGGWHREIFLLSDTYIFTNRLIPIARITTRTTSERFMGNLFVESISSIPQSPFHYGSLPEKRVLITP